MTPRLGDNTPPNYPSGQFGPDPWTQRELELLHDMVREYDMARRVKRAAIKWLVWGMGLPALALTVWEPISRLWKLFKGT